MSRTKRTDVPEELSGPDRDRMRKRAWYLQNREEQLQKRTITNRNKGHSPPLGAGLYKHRQLRVNVPVKERCIIVNGLAFFSRSIPFEREELLAVLQKLQTGSTQENDSSRANSEKISAAKTRRYAIYDRRIVCFNSDLGFTLETVQSILELVDNESVPATNG